MKKIIGWLICYFLGHKFEVIIRCKDKIEQRCSRCGLIIRSIHVQEFMGEFWDAGGLWTEVKPKDVGR